MVARRNDGSSGDVAGFSGARLARIETFFDLEVAQGRVPGAVLLIERHGRTVMRRAWGRRRPSGASMTLDTLFRIYSMTKPIVSVAALMLVAEGRLHLGQPVADFIPAFAGTRVLEDGRLVAPRRPPSVHDLLRHTAGLIYERGGGPVAPYYRDADLLADDPTNETFAARVAALPLAHQPGQVWDYSHATEILGRVVEVAAGRTLGQVLRQRIFEPLTMAETAFSVPTVDPARIAEPFPDDTLSADKLPLFDPTLVRAFEPGGMGLVSTVDDYARFARMLLAGGHLDGTILLTPRSLRFMTSDHVGPCTGITRLPDSLLSPGFGFGLGFAVRTETGAAAYPGSIGEFNWSGIGGTYFWVDPAEDLFVILMVQAPRQRVRHRAILKAMVYDALVGKRAMAEATSKAARQGRD